MVNGSFPFEQKKGNAVPIHKKDDKQFKKKITTLYLCYQSVENFFEKLIFNEMFKCFIENELISLNKSVFKPTDSCINQLLAITHEYANHLMKDLKLDVFF